MSDEKRKRRLVTFADIAAQAGAGGQQAATSPPPERIPPEEVPERATYARLVSLSKRPEDFSGRLPEPVIATPVSSTPATAIPASPRVSPEPAAPRQIPLPAARLHIRKAYSAKDGHSLGERAVYEALWDNGEGHSTDCRIIAIGYRALSAACGLSVNNCKANLHALVRKLAIEESSGHSYTHSKTYLVYNGAAILRRRRAAGLTHYIKTRGVMFVDPETGDYKRCT